MKISLNWIKEFVAIDIPVEQLVEKIGRQLGEVESVEFIGDMYKGALIARVVSCEKHPDADKLSVCLIDDGGTMQDVERTDDGLVRVVCGAPNVRAGLTVVWLPPGSTVPSTYATDPFVLGARALRGIQSNGMLASAQELAIGEDHSGIVEVELDSAPGTSFAEAYKLDDVIIDIENKMFTHRPDCFGILGIAREIAGITGQQFSSPEWYLHGNLPTHSKESIKLSVKNELGGLSPRFMAIAMDGVSVKPSPLYLQSLLSRVGIRPINGVVDVTNYIMYLTGQPLHAYDAHKLQAISGGDEIVLRPRLSKKGETVALINGKTIELDDTTIVIDAGGVPVGVAGVMGGSETEVDDATTAIIVECASFDMYAIRRASMRYGLFTDAVTRFNKGQSMLQNGPVITEAVALLETLSGAKVSSPLRDVVASDKQVEPVLVSVPFINTRLGASLEQGLIVQLLRNVEMDVHEDEHMLTVTPPFWRTDLEIAEDIVEEVGRLFDYAHIPLALPQRTLQPVVPNASLENKRVIRETLRRKGLNEVLTYSFVHKNLLTRAGQNPEDAYELSNALSPELQCFRLSLTPCLLEKVHANVKAGYKRFGVFEMGLVHHKSFVQDGLPGELGRLAAVITDADKKADAYYSARHVVTQLPGCKNVTFKPLSEVTVDFEPFTAAIAPFEPLRSAAVFNDDTLVGVVGEFKQSVIKGFKLPTFTAGFELFISQIGGGSQEYRPLSKFPSVTQDITLRVPANVTYAQIYDALKSALPDDAIKAVITPKSKYHKSDDEYQISFGVSFVSHDRTLTATECNTLLDTVAAAITIDGVARI